MHAAIVQLLFIDAVDIVLHNKHQLISQHKATKINPLPAEWLIKVTGKSAPKDDSQGPRRTEENVAFGATICLR